MKYKFFLLPVLMILTGLFDGIGIVLFFPLLEQLNQTSQTVNSRVFIFFYKILNLFHINNLGGILLFICIIFFIKFLINFFEQLFIQKTMYDFYRKISVEIINGWGQGDYIKLYLSTTTGYFTNILSSAIWTFLGAFQYYCSTLVNIFYILIYIFLSLLLDVKITLIASGCGLTILYFLRNFTNLSKIYSIRYTEENALFQNRLVEFMQFYKYLKSTSQFHKIYKHIEENIKKITTFYFKQGRISTFISAIPEPISVALIALFIYIEIVILNKDFGTILVFIMLFYKTLMRIVSLQGAWHKFFGCSGGIKIIEEALEKVNVYKEERGGIQKNTFQTKIVFEKVNFSYGDKPVLFDLNMTLEKNKTIALVGPSGAGKSTIIDLITGVLKPTSGRILIDGINYNGLDTVSLRDIMGYVMQENVMFNDTVVNNVSLWSNDGVEIEKKVSENCIKAYCDHFIENMPLKYKTIVGDRGVKLSVGQRQRIAIARELYRDTPILILDEATSSLDTESENYIKRSIESLKGNKTLIIIAHRLSTIKHADYIYLIDGGRIIEEGSLKDLFENKDTKFYKMCQLQSF